MTALELIDQMLGKKEFRCTENQMRFLRELVMQMQDPEELKKANLAHHKKVLAALRREVTYRKKELEMAKLELRAAEKEI